jgi:AraC-like DNA-binding protein
MTVKVVINAGDANLWEKLEAIQKIDPAISGGIDAIVHGHRTQNRGTPISLLFSSGYEEVHEIERGFCAHIADTVIDQDWRITASSIDQTLRFRIAFAGEAGYVARDSRVSDASARCSFIVRPPGESLTANFKGGATYRYCSLSLTKNYLFETLQLREDDLPAMLITYWDRRETVMGHFSASKASLTQAGRFFNVRQTGAWHDLAVRTLALDLLRLLFHDWSLSHPRSRTSIRITPAERNKLLGIRDQIEMDPAASITLPAFCAKTRMNRNKLHYAFKQQFGMSIHEYQTELRMQAAMTLLRSTKLAIAQIAERTGYGEPTNFTAAFKKHFAALPRAVRQGLALA